MVGDWSKRMRFWRGRQPPNASMGWKNGLSEKLHQVGQDHLEAETLQDLNGIVGRTVKHHATIGELGMFPFAALAAVAEQAISKEQL